MSLDGDFSKLMDKDISPTDQKLVGAATEAPKAKKPVKKETTIPRHRDTTIPSISNDVVETIRKAVKQLGKEAATHRFTKEEKDAVARIVYEYNLRGIRTSENEIARIGIHYLLEDYQARGKDSILAKVVDALNA